MANTNAPFGLRYLGVYGGPPTNSSMQERRSAILATNTTAIYTGDMIQMSSDGNFYQWVAGLANYLFYGVFAGCRYPSNSQQTVVPQKYWPGTDTSGPVLAQFIPVALTTPTPVFVIQCDGTGIVQGNIGMNVDVNVGTGSTTTGFSGSFLDTTTISTLTTKPLRIIDFYANWAMGNNPEGVGASSTLVPGVQTGAFNYAVVAANSIGAQGV